MKATSRHYANGEDHLLIIRFSAMGDVAMLAPVTNILTRKYPNLQITIVTRGFFSPIFDNIPRVTVYAADLKGQHKGITGLYKLSRELKGLGITAVGDMHNVLRSKMLKFFLMASGIKSRKIDKGRAEKKALTASNNKVFRQLKTTHQRYADVLANLGYPIDLSKPGKLPKHDLSANVLESTGHKESSWIGLAPFAAHIAKAYPIHLVAEVLKQLSQQAQTKTFLFGGGQEETRQLESLASPYENVFSLAGKLKFEEELQVISNLDVMVSMDSGNAHLAAMYGVKVLTLWGVTHPYAGFGAYNQPAHHHLLPDLVKFPDIPTSVYGNKFPAGYENAIATISPEMVIEKINTMLPENKNG